LGEAPEDRLLLFSVLYSAWTASYVASNGDAMGELATQFLTLAEQDGATAPLLTAHRIIGITLTRAGNHAQARSHFDRAMELYDPVEHRPLATRFGSDAAVSILSYRSWALWFLGYPEAALANADRAISDARTVGQAATLMYALAHAPFTYILCGDVGKAKAAVDEVAALADEKGAVFFKPHGMMYRGWLFATAGKVSDAVHTITSAITAWRSTGTAAWLPLYLSCLARAYADLGRSNDARRCLDEATMAVEKTNERWCEAEVYRIAGEIELTSPNRDAARAESHFNRALAIARAQEAKSWELRAAMSMARLWREQGKRQQANDLLAQVYGWFTEGFDTLDLKQAKALLNELA
jgi:predicted ATPase